jgi:hypothetical protein
MRELPSFRFASTPGSRSDQTVTEEIRIALFFTDARACEKNADSIHMERNSGFATVDSSFSLFSGNLR